MEHQRIRQLDGLRGLAALAVVVSHCANAGLIPEIFGKGFGKMGVALFFALSGLLMGRLYLDRPFTGRDIWGFAISRIARVLPLYYVVLLLGLIFGLSFDGAPEGLSWGSAALDSALLWRGNGVLWSVPVEMQFYLAFLALWCIVRLLHLSFVQVVLCALTAQALWIAEGGHELLRDWGETLPLWIHLFLFGLLLSRIPDHSRARLSRALDHGLPPATGFFLVALLPLALPELRRQVGLPVMHNAIDPISVGVPVALLFLAFIESRGLGWLASRPLRTLGALSFGVYLVHLPILSLIQRTALVEVSPALAALAVAVLSVLIAAGLHVLVERPAQRAIKGAAQRAPTPCTGNCPAP
ncbi:acyltransferase family protein [Poseidonocella sedimentorum]|nr:acyltransferase [Poseidonocella sedimentorum]